MNCLPTFLDFEAASFTGHPIEVAWNDAAGNIESYLIKPHPSWTEWDYHAQELHGISQDMLNRDGKDIGWVTTKMEEKLGGSLICSDNPWHEDQWCHMLFRAAGRTMTFGFVPTHMCLPDALVSNPRLMKQYTNVWRTEARSMAGRAHRAANDVQYWVYLWQKILENI